MPSRRLIVALTVTALAGTSGAVASAKAGGNGNGQGNNKTPSTTWYGGRSDDANCITDPAADTCTASGTLDFGTYAMHSDSALKRTSAATGRDYAHDIAYLGQTFLLNKPATSVTATIHFTRIAVDPSTQAASADNVAYAFGAVGGSITDSACTTYGCGADTSQSLSWVAAHTDVAGVDTTSTHDESTPGGYVRPAADQTITVTLAMPDGSRLPAGRISFAGFTYAYSSLGDPQCIGPVSSVNTPAGPIDVPDVAPGVCLPDTPHTGSATSSLSATLSSITYSVRS
jgi:hypothetical protein